MPLDAGWDCSGTPDLLSIEKGQNPYVVAIVGVADANQLTAPLAALRQRFGMARDAEFHGHGMSEEMQAAVLQCGIDLGMVAGALLIDKAVTLQTYPIAELPSAVEFQVEAALHLLNRFCTLYALRELRCDEDIRGRDRQQAFITEVKRLHRALWEGTRLRVQFFPSQKSNLIQLADVVAYTLGCRERGTIHEPELRRLVRTLRENEANLIEGPKSWEK